MWRIFNGFVMVMLLIVAGYVYSIKYEATFHAERISKLRADIRVEKEAIASLKVQWAQLSSPDRIQPLAFKYLTLRPVAVSQFGLIEQLPDRAPVTGPDPIGSLIDMIAEAEPRFTGSVTEGGQ